MSAARRDAPVVPRRLERRRRGSRHRVSPSAVTGLRQREGERQLREPQLPRSRGGRGERERALARRERGVEIELLGREIAEAREQLDPQLDRCVVARRASASSRKRRPSETRSARAKYQPSVPSRIATRRVGRVPRVRERGPEIVVLELQPALPAQPIRPAQPGARLVGERREVLGVSAAGGGEPAALGETLEHVVADRVEHVVAGDAARERHRHDRLVDQRGDEVRDGRLVEAVRRGDRDERGERRAAAVDGELLEQRLLVPVQEVVAPLDELLQRDAARVGRRAVAQERRAALEDGDDLREPEHVHARGGELDRERQPVHAPGDLRRERDSLGVGLEARPRRARTLEEELDGRERLGAERERRAARRTRASPAT